MSIYSTLVMETHLVNTFAYRFMLGLFALAYLFSLSFSPYFGQFLPKVLPMLMILSIALTQLTGRLKWQISTAIIASCFGDVFLALPIANSFILGLGAFLIAQLIYAVTYFQHFDIAKVAHWRKIVVVVVCAFALMMASYLLPATGELKIPVTIYLTVICAMGIAALASGLPAMVAIGALTFIVSDSILALGVFKTPLPMTDVWVMVTYYLAQYLMVQGVVNHQQQTVGQ